MITKNDIEIELIYVNKEDVSKEFIEKVAFTKEEAEEFRALMVDHLNNREKNRGVMQTTPEKRKLKLYSIFDH